MDRDEGTMTMEGRGGCGGRGRLTPALHIDEGHAIFPLLGGVDFGEKIITNREGKRMV